MAVSKLMSSASRETTKKRKPDQSPARAKPKKTGPSHAGGLLNSRAGKDALVNYIVDPERFPSDVVLYHDADFVAINDAFPKGAVHTLLLPRDLAVATRHPLDALQDPEVLARFRAAVPRLKALAASELRRKFGRFSQAEKARIEAMDADPPPDELPPGRDWEAELEVGVHAGPSMNHLHVHVMSREYMGRNGRTGRHYQTFKTPFFVRLDDFPLEEDDGRFGSLKTYLEQDLLCWRCGQNFKRGWKSLEAHLQEEFERWKAE